MRTPYTYLEIESIENDYDQQVPMSVIAFDVNRSFHDNKQVRNVNSVRYVVSKLNENDGWKERLEEIWLKKIGEFEG